MRNLTKSLSDEAASPEETWDGVAPDKAAKRAIFLCKAVMHYKDFTDARLACRARKVHIKFEARHYGEDAEVYDYHILASELIERS